MVSHQLNVVRTGPRGETPAVVLLHSAGLDLTYWDAQIAALGDEFDVIAFDLPGHGASIAPATAITIEQISKSTSTAIAELGVGPVALVGLSVGGLIAQHVALAAPGLVDSLALLDTAARFAPEGQSAMRQRATALREEGMSAILGGLFEHWFLPETRDRRPDIVDRAEKTLMNNDVGVQAALWEMIAAFDSCATLGAIDVPTLVLVGEHDSSSPVSSAEELRGGIPNARMAIIEQAAHLSPIEQPAAVTGHLAAFLHDVETARSR
ncbi:alpha/beta fold hydrolase [Mycobacterium yunnanensis]|uniref:Alpha/beta fold hydrolase n=1 Tax=Mycobacterium yunnanensis TaxID=368477 RepID=A0A9X2YZW7_9MYCO|nr:alpha/beta hydrolase [Mycobacterium yunnanensis]MCV7420585.1 alpha/beta fold hydrolase [Mycobacterium yunnanensis]